MSSKKYYPKAGDVCEFTGASGRKYEVLVCSDIIISGSNKYVIAYDKIDFELYNCEDHWLCKSKNLKLIHRP